MRLTPDYRSDTEKVRVFVAFGQLAAPLAFLLFVLRFLPCGATARADDSTASSHFSVRKEVPAITEAIEDFERYREKKAWEKAFSAIGKVLDAKRDRLMPSQTSGFFVPSRQKVRDELLTLPADGREAYRLFNDAKAAGLLHAIKNADSDVSGGIDIDATASGDTDAALENFVDIYFITSVGDQAADRLGDSLFEEGDFAGALNCWRLILDNYPDTAIAPALLQTKCAIALESTGQWNQFQVIQELVKTRYAGQMIRLAGKDVIAGKFLDEIASVHAAKPSTQVASFENSIASTLDSSPLAKDSFALPASDTPAWQFPLMDDAKMSQLQTQLNQFGWGSMAGDFSTVVPASAVDSQRLYLNWFGVCFAIDLNTGKMLWRTESFGDLPQRLQQMVMQGEWGGSQAYNVAAAGDRVLFVGKSSVPQNGQPSANHLLCLDGATGKLFWKSDKSPLADWSFSGCPLVHGGAIYVVAHPSSSQEMSLLTIQLSDGQLKAQLPLGTPTLGTDMRGMQVAPIPELLEHNGKIYVLTNNGAVVVTDPSTSRVLWAYTFATPIEQQQNFWYNAPAKAPPVAKGAMLIDGDTLFLKDYKAEELYALDLAAPSLKWKRPIEDTVTLAAADAHNLYLVGTEADCIDRETRDLQWSVKLSTGTSCMRPIVSRDRIYVFGERGIHQVQTASGDAGPIFHGFEHEGSGGTLWQTPDRLVTVSNLAVTAYPVGSAVHP